jgi:hypothetical protein
MKYIFILLLISSAASAQIGQQPTSYADSTITLKLTQRSAWWLTKGITINAETRKLPDALKNFVGSGNNPDSTFTVTLKAGLIREGIELLLTRPLLVAYDDYRSIILGQPAVIGYTSLASQLTKIANNGAQRNTAKWLLDWYNARVANFTDLYNEEKNAVIKLVQ